MEEKKNTTNNVTVNNASKKEGKNAMNETKIKKSILDFNMNNLNPDNMIKALNTSASISATNNLIVGLFAAALTGVTIPSYVNKRGTKCPSFTIADDKKCTVKGLVDDKRVVGYSRPTLSRYRTAVKLIIDNGDLELFITDSESRLPFSYDSIIAFYNNRDIFKAHKVTTIKGALSKEWSVIKGWLASGDSDSATDDTKVKFTYNGKEYEVPKTALENFIAKYVEADKEAENK